MNEAKDGRGYNFMNQPSTMRGGEMCAVEQRRNDPIPMVTPANQSEILDMCSRISDYLSTMEQLSGVVEDRIRLVLTEPYPTCDSAVSADKKAKVETGLGDALNGFADRILEVNSRLRDMIDRIRL